MLHKYRRKCTLYRRILDETCWLIREYCSVFLLVLWLRRPSLLHNMCAYEVVLFHHKTIISLEETACSVSV